MHWQLVQVKTNYVGQFMQVDFAPPNFKLTRLQDLLNTGWEPCSVQMMPADSKFSYMYLFKRLHHEQ